MYRYSQLFSTHKFVVIRGPVLVIPFVTYNVRETFFNQLFRNIPAMELLGVIQRNIYQEGLRILTSVPNGRTFTLLVLALPGTNEIDRNADRFANEPLTQELARFLGECTLFGIGYPMKRDHQLSIPFHCNDLLGAAR